MKKKKKRIYNAIIYYILYIYNLYIRYFNKNNHCERSRIEQKLKQQQQQKQ